MQLPVNPHHHGNSGLSRKLLAEITEIKHPPPLNPGILREAISGGGELCYGRVQSGQNNLFFWILPSYHLFLLEQIIK